MKITQIPKDYTGAYTPIEYQIESSKPDQMIEVNIVNQKGETMGVKHLVGESNYRVNIAPHVRRALSVEPKNETESGFYLADERTVAARIKAVLIQSSGKTATSPLSLFTAASGRLIALEALSNAPQRAEIAEDECDEIAFIAPGRVAVAILTLEGKGGSREINIGESGSGAQSNLIGYRCSDGITLFLLNMESILESIEAENRGQYERLTLEIAVKEDELDNRNGAQNNEIDGTTLRQQMEVVAKRCYRVVAKSGERSRLCWVNQMGGVEYYTFTAEKEHTLMVNRSRAYTEQGYKTVGITEQLLTTLRSRIEPRAMIKSLSGVISSPNVWRMEQGEFIPIDVVTSSVVIEDSNPKSVTITIRDAKEGLKKESV